jgi:lipopolysaccharide exporter
MGSVTVQGKMARGALWLMLLTFVDRGLGLLSTLILARLLTPADFGIVAMALSFVFLAQLLAAFGFDVALIHKQDASEAHYHSAWTLNLLLGAVITLVSLAAARPIAIFYHQPAVFWVLCALALGPVIGGCENIGVVAFRKDLEFRKEFRFQLSRRFIGSAVTLPLAFYLRDYWALVAGTLAARLAGTITSYRVHPFRPRLSLTEVTSLMKFSKWMLLSNILGVLKERLSDFFLGRLAGAHALGVYNVSYEFANLPTSEIGAPVNRALLPGFAKLTEPSAVLAAYTDSMSIVALIAIPVAAGILAVAHFFIPVVLGLRWISGVPLMEVMAVGSLMMVFQSSISAVLLGRGYPYVITQMNFVFVVLLVVLMFLLVPPFGTVGAARAFSLTAALVMPLYLYHLRRLLGMPVKTFLLAVVRPLISSIVMVVCVRSFLPEYSPVMATLNATLWLLVGATCGAVIYVVIDALLWLLVGKPAGAERALLDQVIPRLARLVPRRQTNG